MQTTPRTVSTETVRIIGLARMLRHQDRDALNRIAGLWGVRGIDLTDPLAVEGLGDLIELREDLEAATRAPGSR